LANYRPSQELKATEGLVNKIRKKSRPRRGSSGQTKAQQRKDIEESKLKTELETPRSALRLLATRPKKCSRSARPTPTMINLQNESEVAGLRRAGAGFPSVEAFASIRSS